MKRILFLVAVSLFLSSCSAFKPVSVEKIESVKFNSINSEGVDVTLVLRINNPNGYAVKVKQMNLNVHVGGIPVGDVLVNETIKIPARSVTKQSLHFNTSLKNVGLAAIPALLGLANKKQLKIDAEGEIKAGAFLFTKKFKINFSDTVKL